MKALPWILSLALSGAVQACELDVSAGWIRAAPPTASVMGGFALLRNPGSSAVKVVAGSSSAFARVELHEMTMDGDVMRMRKLDAIEVPAGGQVRLAPGELHLMLFDPKAPLASGATAEIELQLDCGAKVSAQFPVREGP